MDKNNETSDDASTSISLVRYTLACFKNIEESVSAISKEKFITRWDNGGIGFTPTLDQNDVIKLSKLCNELLVEVCDANSYLTHLTGHIIENKERKDEPK